MRMKRTTYWEEDSRRLLRMINYRVAWRMSCLKPGSGHARGARILGSWLLDLAGCLNGRVNCEFCCRSWKISGRAGLELAGLWALGCGTWSQSYGGVDDMVEIHESWNLGHGTWMIEALFAGRSAASADVTAASPKGAQFALSNLLGCLTFTDTHELYKEQVVIKPVEREGNPDVSTELSPYEQKWMKAALHASEETLGPDVIRGAVAGTTRRTHATMLQGTWVKSSRVSKFESKPKFTAHHAQPPGAIRDLGVSIIGETCYKSLLLDVDIEDAACLKFAISKALGIGIIAVSSIVKVPQILKLLQSRSAEGVSFLSYVLETSAYLISFAYNYRSGFPFSTFGETALIVGQNVIISVLVLKFSGRTSLAAVFVAALAVSVAALFAEGVLDMKTLSYLQAGAGVLGIASKVPQILTIFQQGGTGQLSAFAVFNYLAGSLSRIFTTLQEVDDKLILYGFISGFVLNAVLALQMVYYWNAPAQKTQGKVQAVPVEAKSTTSSSSTPKKGRTTRRRG
ncbi:hypothetical protein G7046_g2390 [Stylonectria norvegica]|nr:hypothetical protein G7046_g2390 [Stylonectria norvegica]